MKDQAYIEDVDLYRDEFRRILAISENSEVRGLCERAMSRIKVHHPILEYRDRLESHLGRLGMSVEMACAKLSERKTVHQWLNDLGCPTRETTGKPMCLLRRIAVQLGVQPYQ